MYTGKTFTLSGTGGKIPAVGLGTWQSPPGQVRDAVKVAIQSGYRHIDCAAIYRNENEVGEGIKDSAVNDSLKRLGTSYLDLYIIHWPVAFSVNPSKANPKPTIDRALTLDPEPTWRVLESLVQSGKVRNIGISNFTAQKAQALYDKATIKPAVNQVELSLGCPQPALLEWAKQTGVLLQAYSPLGSTGATHRDDPVVMAIAKAHGCDPANVLISWQVQRGCVVLPKSVTASRIVSNFKSVELSASDVAKLEIRAVEALLGCQLEAIAAGFSDVVMTPRDGQLVIHCKAERWERTGGHKHRDCKAELFVLEKSEGGWICVESFPENQSVQHGREGQQRTHPHARLSKCLKPLDHDSPLEIRRGYNEVASAGALNQIEAGLRADAFRSGRFIRAQVGDRTKFYSQSLSFYCDTTHGCPYWVEFVSFPGNSNWECTEATKHGDTCHGTVLLPEQVDGRLKSLLDQVNNERKTASTSSSAIAGPAPVSETKPTLPPASPQSPPTPVQHAPKKQEEYSRKIKDGYSTPLYQFFREICAGDTDVLDSFATGSPDAVSFLERQRFSPNALTRAFAVPEGREMVLKEMASVGVSLAARTLLVTLLKEREGKGGDAQGESLKKLGKRKADSEDDEEELVRRLRRSRGLSV
ncbi:hypothetical protein RQP46_000294 [Phenoliferia psychrophenolica]